MGWKYVMMKSVTPGGTKILTPIIFPGKIVHLEMYTVAKLLLPDQKVTPYSAGTIDGLFVERVGGESSTMKLKSRGNSDASVINGYRYFHGIIGGKTR